MQDGLSYAYPRWQWPWLVQAHWLPTHSNQSPATRTSDGHENEVGFCLLAAVMSKTTLTGKLVSGTATGLWRLTEYMSQAVDMFLETKLSEFSHCKLLELDWEILEGLETVLKVSLLCDSGPKMSVHCNDRSLTVFNRPCHPNLHLSCHMQFPILRCSWQTWKGLEKCMRFSGSGQKSVCAGPQSTIFEWTTQQHILSPCVSS